MGKYSRNKGANGERELAHKLSTFGFNCRRGQQYCGANGDADVVGLPGIHIESKRTENLRLYPALEQSKSDAKDNEIPVVMHRKSRQEWVVILSLDDFMEMYQKSSNTWKE